MTDIQQLINSVFFLTQDINANVPNFACAFSNKYGACCIAIEKVTTNKKGDTVRTELIEIEVEIEDSDLTKKEIVFMLQQQKQILKTFINYQNTVQ